MHLHVELEWPGREARPQQQTEHRWTLGREARLRAGVGPTHEVHGERQCRGLPRGPARACGIEELSSERRGVGRVGAEAQRARKRRGGLGVPLAPAQREAVQLPRRHLVLCCRRRRRRQLGLRNRRTTGDGRPVRHGSGGVSNDGGQATGSVDALQRLHHELRVRQSLLVPPGPQQARAAKLQGVSARPAACGLEVNGRAELLDSALHVALHPRLRALAPRLLRRRSHLVSEPLAHAARQHVDLCAAGRERGQVAQLEEALLARFGGRGGRADAARCLRPRFGSGKSGERGAEAARSLQTGGRASGRGWPTQARCRRRSAQLGL